MLAMAQSRDRRDPSRASARHPGGFRVVDATDDDSEAPGRPGAADDDYTATVRPLLGALVGVARRILGDETQAWDSVQEALISLWLQDERPANPRAWLTRAVLLRALHQARTRTRRRRHEADASRLRPESSERDEPSHRLEWREFAQSLDEAIAQMPAEFREVLVLKVDAELDYAAIAEALSIPIGTVRSRLNRCRNALRDILDDEPTARKGPRSR